MIQIITKKYEFFMSIFTFKTHFIIFSYFHNII
nr:MAG TPA: hypothetical protein [Caudoviricetes sp.]